MTALRRWLWAAAAAVVLLSVPGLPAGAQTRRPMTLVDLAELQRLLAPRLSPDGRTLVYMLSKVDWKAGRPIWHLWRQDINGTPVQLTFSEGGDIPAPRSVRWAPDGKSILFLRAGQISADPGRWRRASRADASRHRASSPIVVAGRHDRLFPRQRSADRRGARARSAARRRLRVRRELQAAATLESERRDRSRTADDDRRDVGPRVPAVARRLDGRDAARARRRSSATASAAKCG